LDLVSLLPWREGASNELLGIRVHRVGLKFPPPLAGGDFQRITWHKSSKVELKFPPPLAGGVGGGGFYSGKTIVKGAKGNLENTPPTRPSPVEGEGERRPSNQPIPLEGKSFELLGIRVHRVGLKFPPPLAGGVGGGGFKHTPNPTFPRRGGRGKTSIKSANSP